MALILANYWKLILGFVLGALVAAGVAHFFQASTVRKMVAAQQAALKTQEATLTKRCDDAKQLSEQSEAAYAAQVDDLNRRVAADELRPSTCVPVDLQSSCPAVMAGSGTGSKPAGHVRSDGLTSTALRSYAKDAATFEHKFYSCETVLNGIYQLNGQ